MGRTLKRIAKTCKASATARLLQDSQRLPDDLTNVEAWERATELHIPDRDGSTRSFVLLKRMPRKGLNDNTYIIPSPRSEEPLSLKVASAGTAKRNQFIKNV